MSVAYEMGGDLPLLEVYVDPVCPLPRDELRFASFPLSFQSILYFQQLLSTRKLGLPCELLMERLFASGFDCAEGVDCDVPEAPE